MLTRRNLILSGATGIAAALFLSGRSSTGAAETFAFTLDDAEWRKRLTPQQYAVLRRSSTERPYTSPLNDEHRRGTFTCAGCDKELFSSTTKFDSGTGWPSFWAALPKAVGEERDASFGMVRTAAHCANCGGHLGHIFDDGPQPTGLRYCMNGVAMSFKPLPA